MTQMRHAFAVTLAGVSLVGVTAFAEAQPKTAAAGRKSESPVTGLADVDYLKLPPRREGATLVTRIRVKNMSAAPISRLTIDETWSDNANHVIGSGKGVARGLLQPGEIQTIEIRTPVDPKMGTGNWMFSHANGAVKQHEVTSFNAPAQASAKPPGARGVSKKK